MACMIVRHELLRDPACLNLQETGQGWSGSLHQKNVLFLHWWCMAPRREDPAPSERWRPPAPCVQQSPARMVSEEGMRPFVRAEVEKRYTIGSLSTVGILNAASWADMVARGAQWFCDDGGGWRAKCVGLLKVEWWNLLWRKDHTDLTFHCAIMRLSSAPARAQPFKPQDPNLKAICEAHSVECAWDHCPLFKKPYFPLLMGFLSHLDRIWATDEQGQSRSVMHRRIVLWCKSCQNLWHRRHGNVSQNFVFM